MGDAIGESLRFEKYMKSLQQVLAIKRYDRDDTPVKVSLLVDVYETEKSWFDDDQRPKPKS